jgi:hypothetical protein
MADFAPNFTARYRFKYSAIGKTHTSTWRVAAGVTDPTAVAAKVGLFLSDLQEALFNDWTVLTADFALADSDVFLPAPLPDQPTASGGSSATHISQAPVALSWIARSIAGGKGRFFLYGTTFGLTIDGSLGQDYRYTSAEEPLIADTIVRLNETSPALVCNDNEPAIWYEYVNVKANDAWVRKARRG